MAQSARWLRENEPLTGTLQTAKALAPQMTVNKPFTELFGVTDTVLSFYTGRNPEHYKFNYIYNISA